MFGEDFHKSKLSVITSARECKYTNISTPWFTGLIVSNCKALSSTSAGITHDKELVQCDKKYNVLDIVFHQLAEAVSSSRQSQNVIFTTHEVAW